MTIEVKMSKGKKNLFFLFINKFKIYENKPHLIINK